MSDAPKFKTFRDLRHIPAKEEKPKLEIVSPTSNTSEPSIASNTSKARDTSITSTGIKRSNTSTTSKGAISPERDFQKVPNSVTKLVLPLGIFTGKSKQVFDYFWSISRGAINPTRYVRRSRPEIKAGSGIGSFVTVDNALAKLEEIGLVKKIETVSGSHDGNHFEVFTPEEVPSLTSITSNTSNTSYTQKVEILVIPESSNTSNSLNADNKEDTGTLKPSLKQYKNDDDALTDFRSVLNDISRKLTGKGLNIRQKEEWKKLAELMAVELERAADLAENSISNVPAFLTHHIAAQLHRARRTTEKKVESKKQVKPDKTKLDTVGKTPETYIDEPQRPLTPSERAETLEILMQSKRNNTLHYREFKSFGEIEYLPDDYQYLCGELDLIIE